MRKHIYILIALSALAALLSALLWNWYYFPENAIGSSSFYSPYLAIADSQWSTLFGIPIFAFGVFIHLVIIFVLLIADYAGGRYPLISIAIIVPASAIMLCINIAGILLNVNAIGSFSFFPTLSLAANLAVFVICVKLYLKISNKGYRSMPGIIKNIFADPGDNPDGKASLAYSILFVFFMITTILSINYIVATKHPPIKVSETQIKAFIDTFDAAPEEELNLPESSMRFGNPDAKITMVIFTDFLCSSCERFFQTEKYLASRFGKKINFVTYHFPLDASCNKYIGDTLYSGSCLASQAAQAAADMGIFDKFMEQFIKTSAGSLGDYTHERISSILSKININPEKKKDFEEAVNSNTTYTAISSHIEAGENLQIDGTPTIFINGKRLANVPPKEMLKVLIKRELKKK